MHSHWELADWLAFQESSHTLAIDMGLARVRLVVFRLGLDKPRAFTITVAGTNGKGSSTAMLSSIYTVAGYKVGWYSSPHLLHYNERIRINNEAVTDALLIEAFRAISAVSQDLTLSYFEWGTLAALWLFKHYDCDIQVLEVGLGGRLDAVNVIDADAVLITPIDIDHQAYLGDTREIIAVEKAGVFRLGQVAVCSDPNPPHSLIDAAQTLQLLLYCLGQDFSWQVLGDNHWHWQGELHAYHLPKPALQGNFQYANAAGVLMLINVLHSRLPVSVSALAQGLSQVSLLGRMDARKLLGKSWLFDVAHNAQSIAVLADYLAVRSEPVIAVFSALSDKDIAAMVNRLSPYIDYWFVAPLGGVRGASLAQLKEAFLSVDKDVIHWCDTLSDACALAQDNDSSLTRLVCGSFVAVEQGFRWLEVVSCSSH
jgi:dihydrofolate synthase/folylpolyglutamate synthase